MAIKKTPAGRWHVDIEPVKGRRFRKTFDTKGEALRFETHIKAEAYRPDWKPTPKDKRRLSELIVLWFDLHGRNLRDSTRRLARLNAMCEFLRNPVAADLTANQFARFRAARLDAGISQRTVNNDLCFINALFNELHRLQEIAYANPLSLVKALRAQEKSLSFLTHDQIAELLTQCEKSGNPHVLPLTMICLSTGCRWSEAENLTAKTVQSGRLSFEGTKSAKVRTVPVSDQLINTVRKHWKQFGPFTGSMTSFRRVLARCTFQLPQGQATHVLRHTFASHFVQQGGNILTLQRILGHSTIQMTMRYAHLAPDHLQEALELNPLSAFDTSSTPFQRA